MKEKKKLYNKSLRKWPFIFLAPFLLSYLAFSLFPTLYSFYISLTDWSGLSIDTKAFVGFDNYLKLFTTDAVFWKSVGNTFYLMLIAMPLTVISGLLIAQLLFTLKKGKNFFQTFNFLPYVTTPIAIGILFSFMFDWNVGSVNHLLKLVGMIDENIYWLGKEWSAPLVVAILCIWKNFGYFMVLYLSGLSTISEDLYEAAKVDGANSAQMFFKITLPMLRPITVFVVINGMIGGFQLFDEALQLFAMGNGALVGGPGKSVLTSVWYFYDTAFKNNARYGYGAAISFMIFLIIAVFSLVNVFILNRKEREA